MYKIVSVSYTHLDVYKRQVYAYVYAKNNTYVYETENIYGSVIINRLKFKQYVIFLKDRYLS